MVSPVHNKRLQERLQERPMLRLVASLCLHLQHPRRALLKIFRLPRHAQAPGRPGPGCEPRAVAAQRQRGLEVAVEGRRRYLLQAEQVRVVVLQLAQLQPRAVVPGERRGRAVGVEAGAPPLAVAEVVAEQVVGAHAQRALVPRGRGQTPREGPGLVGEGLHDGHVGVGGGAVGGGLGGGGAAAGVGGALGRVGGLERGALELAQRARGPGGAGREVRGGRVRVRGDLAEDGGAHVGRGGDVAGARGDGGGGGGWVELVAALPDDAGVLGRGELELQARHQDAADEMAAADGDGLEEGRVVVNGELVFIPVVDEIDGAC
mmetsp:Transcript_16340/g.44342  ORF Transcript_16340/g.44342 Transcript_16340/m.44342 type:complete len:319 (+) Transcript_16340:1829-2785(+)